jgi:hypothetical protein
MPNQRIVTVGGMFSRIKNAHGVNVFELNGQDPQHADVVEAIGDGRVSAATIGAWASGTLVLIVDDNQTQRPSD